MKGIRYIGKKPQRADPTGLTTLIWKQGEIQVVVDSVASKLLQYTDIFEEVEIDEELAKAIEPAAPVKPPAKKKVEEDPRAALVNFSAMKLPALRAHAKAHYNATLPARITEETARRKVIELDTAHRAHYQP